MNNKKDQNSKQHQQEWIVNCGLDTLLCFLLIALESDLGEINFFEGRAFLADFITEIFFLSTLEEIVSLLELLSVTNLASSEHPGLESNVDKVSNLGDCFPHSKVANCGCFISALSEKSC